MKKNVWIINHYSTEMFSGKMGRHYNFAKYLKEKGYNPIVFCSNIEHRTEKIIDTKNKPYIIKKDSFTEFVFIKISPYGKNLKKRIYTMLQFFFSMMKISKNFEKPDIIIGSSVHPLACVAGILLSRKYHCDCISEIRDLWPESLVAYDIISRKSILYKVLLLLEKWIYKNSSKIIFTMENGYQYIKDMGWEAELTRKKFYYINNGVDLKKVFDNKKRYNYVDADLDNKNEIKFVYAGSVREVNDIGKLIKVAKILYSKNIKIIIIGKGPDLKSYINQVKELGLSNIVFKGYINNKYMQSIYRKSDFLIHHSRMTYIFKYGNSNNKLFEYLSSGKPVISTLCYKNNIIKTRKLGICTKSQDAKDICKTMVAMSKMNKSERKIIYNNQKKTIWDFDYKNLVNELIKVIEK